MSNVKRIFLGTKKDLSIGAICSVTDKTAQAYIIYRQKRTEIRESMVDAVEIIDGYVGGSNWRIKENANIGYSIGGLILRTSERVTAEYWLNLYPRAVAEAHKTAAIHALCRHSSPEVRHSQKLLGLGDDLLRHIR